jgi:hypothetical protein
MKLFTCQNCGQLLYFENVRCERCGSALGFSPDHLELLTLTPADDGIFGDYNQPSTHYRYCTNARHQACNWLLPVTDSHAYCVACQFNRTVPDLSEDHHRRLWQKLEVAKHRLIYTLLRLKLPLMPKDTHPEKGLAFDFLADQSLPSGEQQPVMTGHARGLITINLNEADDAHRARLQQEMGERYRTLLGHFRHEVGHYYWELLVANTEHVADFRKIFGDERRDYGDALKVHYEQGAPANWREEFISEYASVHPWEDWAESWAHYLHLVDTLAIAYAFGLQIEPRVTGEESLAAEMDRDAYRIRKFDRLMERWLPLTIAMNSINRSMGQPDLYPFVMADPVLEKLRFIHDVCRASAVN